jgi:hypothetical protein
VGADEIALRAGLESVAFRAGGLRGKWRFLRLSFPHVYIAIAAPKRDVGPPWFLLRAECSNYPAIAPTAQLWDARNDGPLRVGERPHHAGGVLIAFQDWQSCIYHPIDRIGRPHWPDQHNDMAWRQGDDIVRFVETVHALINTSEYVRSTAPAEAAELPEEPLAPVPGRSA